MTRLAVAIACAALVGCVSPRSFLDPGVPAVSYADLGKRAEPLKLKLTVEFQRNGEPFPRADPILRDGAQRVLRATGLIVPTDGEAAGSIRIVMNNIGDLDEAQAKGTKTGLTLGLAGSTVKDAYEMKVSIAADGRTAANTVIKHAMYTSVGNETLPPGVETVPPNVAFDRVLEQMLLRALRDMLKAGALTDRREQGAFSAGRASSRTRRSEAAARPPRARPARARRRRAFAARTRARRGRRRSRARTTA